MLIDTDNDFFNPFLISLLLRFGTGSTVAQSQNLRKFSLRLLNFYLNDFEN